MIAKKHLKCIEQYLVTYINMFVCMSYLKLPSRGDHHLKQSTSQKLWAPVCSTCGVDPFLITTPGSDPLRCWNNPNAPKKI